MKIALVFSEPPEMVTGPRNSVTLLASALKTYFEKVTVFTTHNCEAFIYNDVKIQKLEDNHLTDYDIFVITGVWWPKNIKLAKKLFKNNIPYIISPRSSLMKSSFKKSKFKKNIYYILQAKTYIKRARAIHFLTEDEKNNSYFSEKGFVVGNIVSDSHILQTHSYKKTKTNQIIISFLGRLDINHKGLDLFLESIKICEEILKEKNVSIKINGPDFYGSEKVLHSMINKLKLEEIVVLAPGLYGEEKAEFLKNTDIFIHTSRYEGQPQAVMEAMMCGCAILVSSQTNMGEIIKISNCGVVTDLDVNDISNKLLDLLSSNLDEMKSNAIKFAENNFKSSRVGLTFYDKIKNLVK